MSIFNSIFTPFVTKNTSETFITNLTNQRLKQMFHDCIKGALCSFLVVPSNEICYTRDSFNRFVSSNWITRRIKHEHKYKQFHL